MSTFNLRSLLLTGGIVACSLTAHAQSSKPSIAVQREVCAATLQSLFNKPYLYQGSKLIEGRETHQFRNPEGTYASSCYLHDSAVIWRTDASPSHSAPGRWRTHPADERLTWTHDGKKVVITTKYSDGSGSPSTFSVQALRKSAGLPR